MTNSMRHLDHRCLFSCNLYITEQYHTVSMPLSYYSISFYTFFFFHFLPFQKLCTHILRIKHSILQINVKPTITPLIIKMIILALNVEFMWKSNTCRNKNRVKKNPKLNLHATSMVADWLLAFPRGDQAWQSHLNGVFPKYSNTKSFDIVAVTSCSWTPVCGSTCESNVEGGGCELPLHLKVSYNKKKQNNKKIHIRMSFELLIHFKLFGLIYQTINLTKKKNTETGNSNHTV